jgi:hydrogenase maturation protease
MSRVLIVGFGNPLRRDDGVGWLAASELLAAFPSSEVEVIRVPQLTPELAERVSQTHAVIFIDAARDRAPGELRCQPLQPAPENTRFSHQLSPAAVLGLARELYGANPQAFAITLGGECFDHGESLSDTVADVLPRLLAMVDSLAQQLLLTAPVSSQPNPQ